MVFFTTIRTVVRAAALTACLLALAAGPALSQNVIGGSTPDTSAVLALQSTQKGFLPPRMSTAQRNAIVLPATGLIVYNTTTQSLEVNRGTASTPVWAQVSASEPSTPVNSLLSIPMKSLPAGTFTMGCTSGDSNCDVIERPTRSVTLSAFQIGETEVTKTQWWAVFGSIPAQSTVNPLNPIDYVSWYDALVFCNRLSELLGLTPCYYSDAGFTQVYGKSGSTWSLPNSGTVYWNPAAKGYRLPTEAEWEYAARGGSATNIYSGGNTVVDEIGWYTVNSAGVPNPAKTLYPNGYGLYDMSGNVWELCWDWLTSAYPSSAETNPTGPSTPQTSRVLRGGGYSNVAVVCRVSRRAGALPDSRFIHGFRIARSL